MPVPIQERNEDDKEEQTGAYMQVREDLRRREGFIVRLNRCYWLSAKPVFLALILRLALFYSEC